MSKVSPAMRRVLQAILERKARTGSDLFRAEDLDPNPTRRVYGLLRKLVRLGIVEVAEPGRTSRKGDA